MMKGHIGSVNSLAFDNSGTILASGSWDQTIKLWNVEDQTEIATLKGHTYSVNSIAFNYNGKLLVSVSWDKTIRLWNVLSKT